MVVLLRFRGNNAHNPYNKAGHALDQAVIKKSNNWCDQISSTRSLTLQSFNLEPVLLIDKLSRALLP